MFNTECKKTVSKMILSFILITVTLLSGCQKNTINSAIEFGTIDVSEIDKIELSGTTGGKDGNYSYTLSDQEKKEFVHLLNQVELGDEVDKNQALSSGAVTYYKLYFQGKDVVTLCPGHYFGVDEKYYEFVNFDELWNEFVTFNSKQDTSQQDKWDCSVACAETSKTNNYVVTYSDKKVFSQTGILTFQNSNNFNIIVHLQIPDEEERTAEIPAGGVSSLYQISQNKACTVGVYADVPENETIKLMVYDGAVADLNSSQEKKQVYFDISNIHLFMTCKSGKYYGVPNSKKLYQFLYQTPRKI